MRHTFKHYWARFDQGGRWQLVETWLQPDSKSIDRLHVKAVDWGADALAEEFENWPPPELVEIEQPALAATQNGSNDQPED